ncbi:MAG: hypothetical protein R3E79_12730 [Caldilineaceae bacterium]
MIKFTQDTSTFPLDELLARWGRGDLTEMQMVGHLLQHIDAQEKRIHRVEQHLGLPPLFVVDPAPPKRR